jgi:hypothetical protein
MQQFKIERSDRRIDVALSVRLSATDITGQPVEQDVTTVNVSRKGARLAGIHSKLRAGAQISLARMNNVEQFLIVSCGKENTPIAGQISISAVDPDTTFWNDVLETLTESHLAAADSDNNENAPAKLKAKAHRA